MENLNLDQFNPTVAELTALANGYNDLTIASPDDKEGLKRVHDARMDLRSKRVAITKRGKELREEATAFRNKVIEHEKGLVAIVEPVEIRLENMEDAVNAELERRKRVALLPDRRAKLATIESEATDELLLSMDPEKFAAHFNAEKEAWLARKEAALKAEQERMDADKRAEQEAKEAEARAAEQAKLDEQRERDRQAELEKAKQDAAEGERRRIEAEAKAKAESEANEQAALEKSKRYNAFLKKNEVTVKTTAEGTHLIQRTGDIVRIYKLVDTLTL